MGGREKGKFYNFLFATLATCNMGWGRGEREGTFIISCLLPWQFGNMGVGMRWRGMRGGEKKLSLFSVCFLGNKTLLKEFYS